VAGSEALELDLGVVGKVLSLAALALWVVVQMVFTRYRVGRHEVEVLIFGKVVRRVALGNIDDVLVGTRFPCEPWLNRDVFHGRFMTIRRKKGFFRYLTISPHNPDEFRTNLYYALGWNPKA